MKNFFRKLFGKAMAKNAAWVKELRWKSVMADMMRVKKVFASVNAAMKARGWSRQDRRRFWDGMVDL